MCLFLIVLPLQLRNNLVRDLPNRCNLEYFYVPLADHKLLQSRYILTLLGAWQTLGSPVTGVHLVMYGLFVGVPLSIYRLYYRHIGGASFYTDYQAWGKTRYPEKSL